jgi:hypothetical protein
MGTWIDAMRFAHGILPELIQIPVAYILTDIRSSTSTICTK